MREYMRNYRKLKKTHFEISNRASNKAWHINKKTKPSADLPRQTTTLQRPSEV
jgi:hypothetical protein